jgi:lysophosphatidylcholine acyltransferase/lyso-PAF acetyltransferase
VKRAHFREDSDSTKYDPFRRTDVHKWNLREIYLCAIFLLPMRIAVFFACSVFGWVMAKLDLSFQSYKNGILARQIIKKSAQIIGRLGLFCAGFLYINIEQVNISDLDPSYPYKNSHETDIKAPLIISNHITLWDGLIFMTRPECPGFLSKKELANYPLYGTLAKAMQCFFVERECRTGKDAVMGQLIERIKSFYTSQSCAPLLIFPEGTTTNGEYLISFKKGAFLNFTPLKMYGIKYLNKNFNPSLDVLGTGSVVLLSMCHFYNPVTLVDFGIFNPAYLNLKDEEDWAIYAETVKNIMLKGLNLASSETGFSEKTEYFKILRNELPSRPKIE